MRKNITKEVTFTIIKSATMQLVDNKPIAVENEDELLLGNITKEKAQKLMNKHNPNVVVYDATVTTKTYTMDIHEFIKQATEKVETS